MAGIVFTMKRFGSRSTLSPRRVRAEILNALKEEGREIKRELTEDVTGTWREHKPNFSEPVVRYAGGDALVMVAYGQDEAGDVFRFLDEGTRIRYAKLSPDWVSKTAPGKLKSGQGAGHVMRRGYEAGPHPGIKARGWTDLIKQKHAFSMAIRIRYAIAKGTSAP